MFENRSEKQLIIIYAFIAIAFAIGAFYFNYITRVNIYYNIFAANVIFFCIFYILYLPLKIKRARKKQEESKKK
jgi:membrane protein YdbS with pleckstrin-like domain